jgi:hypothetical protein
MTVEQMPVGHLVGAATVVEFTGKATSPLPIWTQRRYRLEPRGSL